MIRRAAACLGGLIFLVPLPALATWSADGVSFLCSAGDYAATFDNGVQYACAGDFSLRGGAISSDTRVGISAGGSLRLDGITITAPEIWLAANTLDIENGTLLSSAGGETSGTPGVALLPGARLVVGGREIGTVGGSGTVTIGAGGDISLSGGQITPAVPEPALPLLWLAGLGVLLLRSRPAGAGPAPATALSGS